MINMYAQRLPPLAYSYYCTCLGDGVQRVRHRCLSIDDRPAEMLCVQCVCVLVFLFSGFGTVNFLQKALGQRHTTHFKFSVCFRSTLTDREPTDETVANVLAGLGSINEGARRPIVGSLHMQAGGHNVHCKKVGG